MPVKISAEYLHNGGKPEDSGAVLVFYPSHIANAHEEILKKIRY